MKNPNGGEDVAHRSPQEIMDEIAALDAESAEVLRNQGAAMKNGWQTRRWRRVPVYARPTIGSETFHQEPVLISSESDWLSSDLCGDSDEDFAVLDDIKHRVTCNR